MSVTLTSLGRLIYRLLDAALFGWLLLVAFLITYWLGKWPLVWGDWSLARYDFLLFYALAIQAWLLYTHRETWQEAGVIAIFHVLAMLMELFLTSPQIGSWHYPEAGHFRINNVPLFAGFMYSAVGSFLVRAQRIFDIRWHALPAWPWLMLLALASYLNFFTHHFIFDFRWILMGLSVIAFWRTTLEIDLGQPQRQLFKLHFLPILLGLAVLVWIAENIATFSNIWLYPSQRDAWHWVGIGKIGSWYLLLLLSLGLVLALQRASMGKTSERPSS